MDSSVISQPLKLKNKSLMQILNDNLELLLFPVIAETLLIGFQKTRIYGIILFILITLLTIILYKIHKYRLYKKIIELTESKEFKYKISLRLNDLHPYFFCVDVWKGMYEEIVDLKTNTVLTSKELKAFLN